MATEPTNPIIRIAEQDTVLPTTQQSNKLEPITEVQTTGFDQNIIVSAEELNYIFDNFGEWLQYLADEGVSLRDVDIIAGDGLSGGGNLTQDRTLTVDDSIARSAIQISAGNGMTGGGDLTENRTLTLGTPSTVGDGSTNSTTSDSHTHELTLNNNISILTGTLTNGGTIPLPSGYTQAQCKWTVGAGSFNDTNTGDDIAQFTASVNSSRVVTALTEGFANNNYVNYIIIGVK